MTQRWSRVASAVVLLLACARSAPHDTGSGSPASSAAMRPKAPVIEAEVAEVPATLGAAAASAEVEQLIALSKTALSPEQKRTRLQAALERFPAHSKQREELIVAAVAGGAIDPPEWTTIVSNYQGRRA